MFLIDRRTYGGTWNETTMATCDGDAAFIICIDQWLLFFWFWGNSNASRVKGRGNKRK